MREVTEERLERYFELTRRAVNLVEGCERDERGDDVFDLATRYLRDAEHFYEEDRYVLAYGALNFAHGLLDSCVRIGLFDVYDPEVFTQLDE